MIKLDSLRPELLILLFLCASLRSVAPAQDTEPILQFPQAGLDDTAAYRGYRTRFFRDSDGNTVQLAINQTTGRVVNLWADAADESISFTLRDSMHQPAPTAWASEGAALSRDRTRRFLQYRLRTGSRAIDIGLFLLASMRKERDFQYLHKDLLPLDSEPYEEKPLPELLANLARLSETERARHLNLLHAGSIQEVRSRLTPNFAQSVEAGSWIITVTQPTFDGRNLLSLGISGDTTQSRASLLGNVISMHSAGPGPITCMICIGTDSRSLTPLTRDKLFKDDFFHYYRRITADRDSLRHLRPPTLPSSSERRSPYRVERFERQLKSVELLSSREKLMAGLPNYGTYFGRDMMMSAMMMESILQPAVREHVIDCVLRKLSPRGEVSHEEALGGQAIRENAEEYNRMLGEYFQVKQSGNSSAADSVLTRSRAVLSDLQRVRENYAMVDETFQLPVVVGRYLSARDVSAPEKKAFLLGKVDGIPRLSLIMRNLLYVLQQASPFEARREATSLVSFTRLEDHRWRSGSWRDSGAGYANGRFGMDINVIWVPGALEAAKTIFSTVHSLGLTAAGIDSVSPDAGRILIRRYVQNPSALDTMIRIWHSAKQFFIVTIPPGEVRNRIAAKLSWLPEAERRYWSANLEQTSAGNTQIRFLALSLDSLGKPIPVVNSDPATWLFLKNFPEDIRRGAATTDDVLELVNPFITPFPLGLFIGGLGPLVANDAFADSDVWDRFRSDEYHSPRVVWGREANLFLLGVCHQITLARDARGPDIGAGAGPYIRHLRDALATVHHAIEASGLNDSELWSYAISGGALVPARYAASCDIQLWNLTTLAVEYELDRLSP
jgi:hypothetical protein